MFGAQNHSSIEKHPNGIVIPGGIFLDNGFPNSILKTISGKDSKFENPFSSMFCCSKPLFEFPACGFLCLNLSVSKRKGDFGSPDEIFGYKKDNGRFEEVEVDKKPDPKLSRRGGSRGAVNTTKHLWAGATAAMVARTFVAPLERLKLEYMLRGEEKKLWDLIKTIAATQGLRGFWKGNLVNILRTAPFKAVNFYAFDTYQKQLLKLSGNEETSNSERFIAGAAAGVTATVLCLPLDTIRTKMVAPGGEALGGVLRAFHHVIQTEGFFSLYKGLMPSILSIAPSAAVFYGVYGMLKSAYLHSVEGRKRTENKLRQDQELNALDQLELGPVRTLLHGAISGACAEVATYPFEVVRRQLQLQGRANKVNALAICAKIVEQGGIPSLYAGVIPSLLQVLPSAAISYFVYEFMKIILKVE